MRSDDEGVLAAQIIAGRLTLAGRRVPDRELAAARGAPASAALLARVDASTLARDLGRATARRQQDWVGDLGAGQHARLQHAATCRPSQLPQLGARARRPEVEGQARSRPDRDRLPADRDRRRRALRAGARGRVAGGDAGATPAAASTPTTRRSSPRSTAGQAELGVINHYYWYRLRDEIGSTNIHSAEHFFAPATRAT